jgi:subtilisin-like proprotein convertase family protein
MSIFLCQPIHTSNFIIHDLLFPSPINPINPINQSTNQPNYSITQLPITNPYNLPLPQHLTAPHSCKSLDTRKLIRYTHLPLMLLRSLSCLIEIPIFSQKFNSQGGGVRETITVSYTPIISFNTFSGGKMKKRVLFVTVLLIAIMSFTTVLLAESGPTLHVIDREIPDGGGCSATSTGNGGSIPDNSPAGICFQTDVSGPANATIVDVNVEVAATHTWIGDLVFTLESPDATILTLMDRPGLPVVNAIVGDDDDLVAGSPISYIDSSANPAEEMGDGSTATNIVVCQGDGVCDYSPDDAFSTLAGENVNGTWEFCASDNAGLDTGSITSFTVNVSCDGGDPPAPALALTKTVGLDPTACATESNLTIEAGGGGSDVTYCYYMTNTGNVTFTLHHVNDDQLGDVLGPGFASAVGPGNSAFFTVTTLITQTTVNVASWTASDADGVYTATAASTAVVTRGTPTDVSVSEFGSVPTSLTPIWLAALLLVVVGFGLVLRRKMVG